MMYTLSKKVHLAVNLQVKSFDPGLRAGSTAAGAADYALVLDFIRQDSDVLSINCSSIGILRLLPPTLIRHLSRVRSLAAAFKLSASDSVDPGAQY